MLRMSLMASAGALAALPALAAGDLSSKTTRLPEIKLGAPDNDYAVSPARLEIETGKSYRLSITAAGSKEMGWKAPEFFRSIWVREVRVGDLEVHTPVVEHLEFDGEGTIDLYFVAIRSGTFPWRIEGLEEQGMKGAIVVK